MCGQGGLAGADLSLDLRTKESLGMKAFGGQPWGLSSCSGSAIDAT